MTMIILFALGYCAGILNVPKTKGTLKQAIYEVVVVVQSVLGLAVGARPTDLYIQGIYH